MLYKEASDCRPDRSSDPAPELVGRRRVEAGVRIDRHTWGFTVDSDLPVSWLVGEVARKYASTLVDAQVQQEVRLVHAANREPLDVGMTIGEALYSDGEILEGVVSASNTSTDHQKQQRRRQSAEHARNLLHGALCIGDTAVDNDAAVDRRERTFVAPKTDSKWLMGSVDRFTQQRTPSGRFMSDLQEPVPSVGEYDVAAGIDATSNHFAGGFGKPSTTTRQNMGMGGTAERFQTRERGPGPGDYDPRPSLHVAPVHGEILKPGDARGGSHVRMRKKKSGAAFRRRVRPPKPTVIPPEARRPPAAPPIWDMPPEPHRSTIDGLESDIASIRQLQRQQQGASAAEKWAVKKRLDARRAQLLLRKRADKGTFGAGHNTAGTF